MNDDETKVMTFTHVIPVSVTPTAEGSVTVVNATSLVGSLQISGSDLNAITPQSGRIFFAGMMFDRLRIRSVSCVLRPQVMPSSTASNYTLYAAWDRYGGVADTAQENSYSILTDPSAKQVTWSSGGSGIPLRTWVYSTRRDRYQYFPVVHNSSLVSWSFGSSATSSAGAPFFPTLLLSMTAITAPETAVQLTILSRVTVEFQGGYSNNTLNYIPPASRTVEDTLSPAKLYELRRDQDVDSLTKRIQQFQMENPDEQ